MMKHNQSGSKKKIPPILKDLTECMKMEFDYEINSIKLDADEELLCKMYYYDKKTSSYRIVNYNSLWDAKNLDYLEEKEGKIKPKSKVNKAWCLKRLVSKKKRRFENEQFDLDMAYVTKRVIAMGYPSTGCERFFRNSVSEVIRFFHFYHNDNVKIYNLCIEKDRIYNKNIFNKSSVALFPAKDHNPCPIKLILDFCVDICLYLIKNPDGVAAVHCKAGKGRTGVMICSYLIFAGWCETSEDALNHYAEARTTNKKGITIPSQIRYIQYFETFLATNFCRPYVSLIPKIVKPQLNTNTKTTNILLNLLNDPSYFISPNDFIIKHIRIGPIKNKSTISIKLCDFSLEEIKSENVNKKYEAIKGSDNMYYYIYEMKDPIKLNCDLKISVKGAGLDFYIWLNPWHSTLKVIKFFLEEFHKDVVQEHKIRKMANKKHTVIVGTDRESEFPLNKREEGLNLLVSNKKLKFDHSFTLQNKSNESIHGKFYDQLDDSEEIKKSKFKNKNVSEISLLEKHTSNKFVSSEPNQEDNLYDIIYKLKHNTDLNVLINTINKILYREENKKLFNKNDMYITLTAKELDKISKNVNKDFKVDVCYSLYEKK